MPTTVSLLGFATAALILLLIPGPAVFYIIARSVGQGRRAGLISVIGLSTGVLVHIAAAAAGISAVLLASATAFDVVKSLGSGYLIYLGLRTLLTHRPPQVNETPTFRSSSRLFLDGVVVSILNPKLALFFLAFLPQFVDPRRGPVPEQIVLLGLLYIGLALITDSAYAMLAGTLRRYFHGPLTRSPWPRYVSGTVYLGLGVGTALSGRRP